jgi:hypothetical protein
LAGAARHRSERRFAVYLNNVAAASRRGPGDEVSVVRRLVGDELFRAMAHLYATAELPRFPLMLYYGETFPAFIEDFAPAAPIPYLADVARIEMARALAYRAADATPLGAETCHRLLGRLLSSDFWTRPCHRNGGGRLAALPMDRVSELRVRLHPSISIIMSNYPIFSIWHINQDPDTFVPVPFFARESVLVARPHLRVKTQRQPRNGGIYRCAGAAGNPRGEAGDLTAAAESLAFLINALIVVGFSDHIGALAYH